MTEGTAAIKRHSGAMEFLGMEGFSLFFCWMILSFYWLFAEFFADTPSAARDGVQLFVFGGITLGYGILHFVGRYPAFDPFSKPLVAAVAAGTIMLPAASFAAYLGFDVPLPLLSAAALCAGLAGSMLTVSWLDVASRIRLRGYGRFTSLSLLGGGVLFVLVALMPPVVQPVLAAVASLVSITLLAFTSARGNALFDFDENSEDERPWKFEREIEPSLFAFGIAFALTFVYLMNFGGATALIGLAFVVPGAGVIAALSLAGKVVNITTVQRALLCITVLACLFTPFVSDAMQLACAGLVVASWAALVAVNYALLVRKSVEHWKGPVFHQVPLRLLFSAAGFFTGWAVATAATATIGAHSDAFTWIRLVMAFVLVAVVMVFFPQSSHHNLDERSIDSPVPTSAPAAASAVLGERELLQRRCRAIAGLYQLSPRETDILEFLAKGRNAAYIQNKLTISPHTVKSHIYSIYRKLDIHSQQKLMDFVEDYPIDANVPNTPAR